MCACVYAKETETDQEWGCKLRVDTRLRESGDCGQLARLKGQGQSLSVPAWAAGLLRVSTGDR